MYLHKITSYIAVISTINKTTGAYLASHTGPKRAYLAYQPIGCASRARIIVLLSILCTQSLTDQLSQTTLSELISFIFRVPKQLEPLLVENNSNPHYSAWTDLKPWMRMFNFYPIIINLSFKIDGAHSPEIVPAGGMFLMEHLRLSFFV